MKNNFYDPMFYICSEQMDFTIKIEINMKEAVDGLCLSEAVRKASERFPYFFIRLEKDENEIYAVRNLSPMVVYEGKEIYPLGGSEVNGHMMALSFYGNTIAVHCSHVITDGRGLMPFIKTVLFYYIEKRYKITLDHEGIYLPGSDFFDDEVTNPYPEEKIAKAKPWYVQKDKPYFRLANSKYVTDSEATIYKIAVSEKDILKYGHENDASPCALISSLAAKAVWNLHPEIKEDIVSAVSFDQRPAIKNNRNYRMLCGSLRLFYPERLRDAEISKVCTCTRGMISLQSSEENVLFNLKKRFEMLNEIEKISGTKGKCDKLGEIALNDANNNTYSVSYVGKVDWGQMLPYIESIYNITDACTFNNLFVEISTIRGWAYISFLQGFSSDAYFRGFIDELEKSGLEYVIKGREPLRTAKMILP